jgi:hypothetical protein
MHIHIVPNRGSHPTVLLRESYRDGTKVHKRTLANLSSLSMAQVEAIRSVLLGQELRPVAQCFEITASRAHGHVQAVALSMQRLGLASLIASKPCRERDLVLAMVASRILAPCTKLATTRGTPRRWPKISVWPTPAKMICTPRWIGCSSAKARSRGNSPLAI